VCRYGSREKDGHNRTVKGVEGEANYVTGRNAQNLIRVSEFLETAERFYGRSKYE